MKFTDVKTKRNLCVIVGILLVVFMSFFICPATASAADEAAETDAEPVPEGSADIGGVDVTDSSGTQTVDTEPEIQDALGLADDTDLSYENTTEQNAVQQAIDAALGYASGNAEITSATVLVDDGTYTGGLTVNTTHTVTSVDEATGTQTTTEETYDLAEDFILKIIAKDAEAEDGSMTNSAGGAGVEGDIDINGIDVILAGLYFVSDSVVKAKSADVSISGTTLDDTISTDITDGASVSIDGGAGNDDISVNGTLGTSLGSDDNSINIDGGGGDDTVNIDTSATNATRGKTTVTINGGSGGDKLNLTGTISSSAANTGVRSGAYSENADVTVFTSALAGVLIRQLDIDTLSVESYIDELSGKANVDLSGSSSYYLPGAASFTNYKITDYDGTALSVTLPDGLAPFLAGLIINGSDFEVGSIYAPAFNLSINGKCITVNGTLNARNINITASDSDVQISLYTDFDSSVIPDFEFEFSLFDFVSAACITISEGAALTASETITLKVTSTQTQSLLPDASQLSQAITNLTTKAKDPTNPNQTQDASKLDALKKLAVNPNFINVKVGSAVITISGAMTAASSISASACAKNHNVGNEQRPC